MVSCFEGFVLDVVVTACKAREDSGVVFPHPVQDIGEERDDCELVLELWIFFFNLSQGISYLK